MMRQTKVSDPVVNDLELEDPSKEKDSNPLDELFDD